MTNTGSEIRDCAPNNRAGFTLIEILAVVLIIGIAITVVTLNLEAVSPKYQLRSASREVGTVIRRARNQAITTGTFYELSYNTDKNRISILPTNRTEVLDSTDKNFLYVDREDKDVTEDRTENQPLYTYNLPEGIEIEKVIIQSDRDEQEKGKILIGPYGYIRPHLVYLRGEGELKQTVIPNPLTGTVSYRADHVNEEMVIQDDRSSLK